jgi:hypothetical protein
MGEDPRPEEAVSDRDLARNLDATAARLGHLMCVTWELPFGRTITSGPPP